MKLSFRQGTANELDEAAKITSILQPSMYVSGDLLHAFLKKYPKWYLTFAETEDGQIVAYDIRYAMSQETIMVHQSGVLMEYLPTGVWKELLTYAHFLPAKDGYKFTQCYLQDYSAEMIHFTSELEGRVFGYHHNRYVNAGTRNISALTIEIPIHTITPRPARLRKPNFKGISFENIERQDGGYDFQLFSDQKLLGKGSYYVNETAVHLDVKEEYTPESLIALCCAADLLEDAYRRTITVKANRTDLIASMTAIHLYTCGFRSATKGRESLVYLHRRYPKGYQGVQEKRAHWVNQNGMKGGFPVGN